MGNTESKPVDVLEVLRSLRAKSLDHLSPDEYEQAVEAHAAVNGLLAFAENIATAYSEPLNSMCVCKRLEDRRHWMGDLRRSARAALARCGVDA